LSPPDEIRSPLVLALFAYWDRIRAERFAPRWADVQPGDIKPLLPYIMVLEVLADPFDIRYRIVGSAVVEAYGWDFTGETLRLPEPVAETEAWVEILGQLVARRGPCFAQYRVALDLNDTFIVDAGVFPLSSDGASVDRLIALEDWGVQGAMRPTIVEPSVRNFHILPATES
jgi:hypothetical protein